MMRSFFLRSLLVIIAASMVPSLASAQLGRLGRRAQEALERRVEQKVDQKIDEIAQRTVDRSFDSIFGAEDEAAARSGGEARAGGATPRIFSAMANATTEDRYEFSTVITYEMEVTRNGRRANDKNVMMSHFNPSAAYTGTRMITKEGNKQEEAFVVFDIKNESMVMLIDSEDGKFAMAYSWKGAVDYALDQADVEDDLPENLSFELIGSKKIAGYDADGYRMEGRDGTSEVWVSRDPALSFGRLFGANSSMKQMRSAVPSEYPQGMLLEAITTDKNGDRTVMTATDVNTSARVRVEMSEYQKMMK